MDASHVYPHVGRLRMVLEFGAPTHVDGSLGRLRMCVGLEFVSRLRPPYARLRRGPRTLNYHPLWHLQQINGARHLAYQASHGPLV